MAESALNRVVVFARGKRFAVWGVCLLCSSWVVGIAVGLIIESGVDFPSWFEVVKLAIMMPFACVFGVAMLLNWSLFGRALFAVVGTACVGIGAVLFSAACPDWGQVQGWVLWEQWQTPLIFVLVFSIPCAVARIFLNVTIGTEDFRERTSSIVELFLVTAIVASTISLIFNVDFEAMGFSSEAMSPAMFFHCLLYTSPSPRDRTRSRMPSSA